MAKKKFTESEINRLRASSYVLDISPTIVHFSAGFKKKFWDALITGKRSRDIVIELEIDPDILGETCINGLKSIIRNEVKAGNDALRHQREEEDQKDFQLIIGAYQHRGYDKGARGIYMKFLHMNPPIVMNIKKIRRLMKKYELLKRRLFQRTALVLWHWHIFNGLLIGLLFLLFHEIPPKIN